MKNIMVLFCLTFLATSTFAASKCYSRKELTGREAMVKGLLNNDASLFDQFCKDNASKVTCASKQVANEQVKSATSEMMKGHSCGEVSGLKNKDGKTTTLYFFDSEKK